MALPEGSEPVFTMPGFYDGPRQGIAKFSGEPHVYKSTFADMSKEDRQDVYLLTPLDDGCENLPTFGLSLSHNALART